MLDPQQPVDLPGLPVRAFRDHVRPHGFYLLPAAPRVAHDEDGKQSLNLTVYGRQSSGRFEPRGGVLTLTTALEVERGTEQRARAALAHRMAGRAEDAPAVEILAIEWLAGTVTVHLTDQLTFSGRPSLTLPNTCAFNERITRDGVGSLLDAWRRGLPGGRIVYALRARTVAAMAPTGEGTPFRFEGPLDVSSDALAAAMTTTAL